ncbi:unnamed protein product [Closterium sp. NIES-54]
MQTVGLHQHPLPPQGPAPSGVSQVDPVEPVEVAVDSGATGGSASSGSASGGAEPAGAGPGGTEPACTEPGVAESEGAEPERSEPGGVEPGGAEPGGTFSPGGPPAGGSAARGTRAPGPGGTGAAGAGGAAGVGAGGTGARAAGGTGAGAAGVTGAAGPGGARTGGTKAFGAGGAAGDGAGDPGAGAAGGTGAAGPGGARTGGTGAAGAGGAPGVGAGDPGAGDTGTGGAGPGGACAVGAGSGDTGRPRPYFVPLLQQPASPLPALGFTPSTADPSPFLRTDTLLPPFYVLVYIDDFVFATADTEALVLVKSKLKKRHTCTDLGELRSYLGLQITWDKARRTITLSQSHMVHQILQRFGFRYSLPQSTPLPTGHLLSAPPSNESVEPSGLYPELGMGLVLGGRGPVVLTGHADASCVDDLAMHRSSQGYTFSLGSGSVSWRSTRSSSVLSSSCEAEIYAGAMAAQELRWLTYLLTDLGERPRSSPVLYVDNKAMIALCHEHRMERRTNHIALRYFLARELQQRGQLRLAYMATRANTADIFTKALQSGDHQRFCTVLGLVPSLPHLLTA